MHPNLVVTGGFRGLEDSSRCDCEQNELNSRQEETPPTVQFFENAGGGPVGEWCE